MPLSRARTPWFNRTTKISVLHTEDYNFNTQLLEGHEHSDHCEEIERLWKLDSAFSFSQNSFYSWVLKGLLSG